MQDYPILTLLLQKSQSPLKLLFPQPQSLPKLLPTDTLPPLKKNRSSTDAIADLAL